MSKAFTLVELLIVIAIMSILASITVAQFQTAKKKANDISRKTDLNGVSKALQMYFADYGVMPTMSDPTGGKIKLKTVIVNWGGEFVDGNYVYMKVVPKENSPNLPPYCYKTDIDNKKYALFAQLENIADKECEGNAYLCGGNTYCFSYVSPNTSLNTTGDLQ
ncbi:MAG: type II secretion system protein [Candidatus Shapirobacteria bacterium]